MHDNLILRVLYKFLLSFALVLFMCVHALAQILDDSTKNVYGPNTTKYVLEKDIKFNQPVDHSLDTLLNDFHQYTFIERSEYKYQNLGNLATASNPVYYSPPSVIGATSGFYVYNPYFLHPDQIRYFDTRSPYSHLFYGIGGNGRSYVDIDFSRNINPNWNVGFDFRRISADKQLGPLASRDDKNSVSNAYDLYTRYYSPNKKYQILANFSRLGHTVAEAGGIVPDASGQISELFGYEDAVIWLQQAESREVRSNIHVYQEYVLKPAFQLYHELDLTNQENSFRSDLNPSDTLYFNDIRFDTSTVDQSTFRQFQNEFGVKGDVADLFYSFYIKRRDLEYKNEYLTRQGVRGSSIIEGENYGGFNLRFDVNDATQVGGFGEYMLGGNFKLGGYVNTSLFDFSYEKYLYQAPYKYQAYSGNHYAWSNNFDPVSSDILKGNIKVRLPFMSLVPEVSYANIRNQIYFNTDTVPAQMGKAASLLSAGFRLNISFLKRFHLKNYFVYTNISGPGADVFRTPEMFANVQFFYSNLFFNEKLNLQAGINLHYQSAYFADAYEPVTQQFFLQNSFQVPEYVLADVFINFKINRARVFLKMNNITQIAGIDPGYFTTPYYTGLKGTFDVGIHWKFFD